MGEEIEMTTKKIYGPWVKWDGGECPVPDDTRVEVKCRSGKVLEPRLAYRYSWSHIDSNSDIVEYHTVTEQPDLEAAENLLRENGYTITPPTKPLTFEDLTPMTEAPSEGASYWTVSPYSKDGVARFRWEDEDFDEAALRHRMAYLEREHALIAARHIFGLKGGEL